MSASPPEPSPGEFDPRAYLIQNYSSLDYDSNEAFLHFLVASYGRLGPNAVLLEFGGGPALCSPLAAAHVREIHFCDYLESNLREVRRWLESRPDAFNWEPFIRRILEIELSRSVAVRELEERAALLRSKLKVVGRCDATKLPPLDRAPERRYDAVAAHFVINAAASSSELLDHGLANICSLLEPGGMLILTSSINRSDYRVGRQRFPLLRLEPEDLLAGLSRLGFARSDIEAVLVPSRAYGSPDGYIFIRAGGS